MGISYSTDIKNARMSAVVTGLGASGVLEICSAGYSTVLATIPLANPAGTVSGGVLTLSTPISDTSADASGTAAVARAKDGSGNVKASGMTVGTSDADIIIASTTIVAAQTLSINSATITHAA